MERTNHNSVAKRKWLWLFWSYLAAFVIADLVIASWFFFSKDINSIYDPYGRDALDAFVGRLYWASVFSAFIALIVPIAGGVWCVVWRSGKGS